MWLIKNKKLRLAMGVLETINLLFIRLAIKNRRNCRRFPGRVFREYMSLVEKDQWISKDIFSLVNIPRGTRITLEHLTGEGIDVWLDELAYLALITKTSRPRNVFEIGTYRGRTALSFALNSPDDCTIWTLDLPPNQRERFDDKVIAADLSVIKTSSPGAEYKGKDVEPKIRQLYGNSLTFDFSPYFGNMDIVFVDGAHHYEAVKSDTAMH